MKKNTAVHNCKVSGLHYQYLKLIT